MKYTTLAGLIVCSFVLVGKTSYADVLGAEPSGFTSVNEATIDAPRQMVWSAAVNDIDQWWSSDHTVSGEANRLSITAKPQGCFCERLGEDAGVVHMTVTMVNPEVVLRLTGGLGPLGLMGVNGNMTWEFDEAGTKTDVKFTYAVGGYRQGGLDGIADPVDGVIREALLRLKAHIENGNADHINVE